MKTIVSHYYNALFKGFGQIMLQGNAITGILFIAAIFYDSALMGVAGLVSNLVGIGTAKLMKFEDEDIENGLYGFNASLIGVALIFYFESNIWVWLGIIIASIIATIAMGYAVKYKLPAYTFPFVGMTWITLFVLSIPELAIHSVPEHFVDIEELDDFLIEGHAFGQVIFQGSFIAGVIFFLGVFISRPINALYAFVAVMISVFISHYVDISDDLVKEGVLSFNAVLCGIAMGGDKVRDGIYVLISVTIATYIDALMIEYGWTALTFPFVFAMWVMYPIRRFDGWLVAKYFSKKPNLA